MGAVMNFIFLLNVLIVHACLAAGAMRICMDITLNLCELMPTITALKERGTWIGRWINYVKSGKICRAGHSWIGTKLSNSLFTTLFSAKFPFKFLN